MLTESQNILRIMSFTESVHECHELNVGQDINTFKEIRDPRHFHRFVMFKIGARVRYHNKYQLALEDCLDRFVEGDAVIKMNAVLQNDNIVLIGRDSHLDGAKLVGYATIVDRDKLNVDERAALSDLIENTQMKMQLNQHQIELAKVQSKVDKMSAGIAQIQDAASKAKSSLGSRNVNALKKVVAEVVEKTK